MTSVIFDVVVNDPLKVDISLYNFWIQGINVNEAAKKRATSLGRQLTDNQSMLVFRDTQDHYRNFHLLKHYLEQPRSLRHQMLLQLAPQMQRVLIQKYYEFDEVVIRELVGKKLKNSVRKDLDEESEKLHVSIQSCRRQFDNLRRIMKTVGDLEGNPVELIMSAFLLNRALATRYGRIIFLCYHRLEAHKKHHGKLEFADLERLAALMMEQWTTQPPPQQQQQQPQHQQQQPLSPSSSASSGALQSSATAPPAAASASPVVVVVVNAPAAEDLLVRAPGLQLEKQFVDVLRDIKAILTSEKAQVERLRTRVQSELQSAGWDERRLKALESRFGSLLKALLHVAAGLSQQRELRELLPSLAEKVGEQLERLQLSGREAEELLRALQRAFDGAVPVPSSSARLQQRYARIWHRYIAVIRPAVALLYARRMIEPS